MQTAGPFKIALCFYVCLCIYSLITFMRGKIKSCSNDHHTNLLTHDCDLLIMRN